MHIIFALLAAVLAAAAPAEAKFQWMENNPSWTQDNDDFRSSGLDKHPASSILHKEGKWVAESADDNWAVFDFGRPMTLTQVRLVAGGVSYSPKHGELQIGETEEGPWEKAVSFDMKKASGWQSFGGFLKNSRFWRLYLDDTWQAKKGDSKKGMELYQVQFFGGFPVECGDTVTIFSENVKRFWTVDSKTGVTASAMQPSMSGQQFFKVSCINRNDGEVLSFGDLITLRNKSNKRFVSNEKRTDATSATRQTIEMGNDKTADDHEVFEVFAPKDMNARGHVDGGVQVVLRDEHTRLIASQTGTSALRTEQYGAKGDNPDSIMRFNVLARDRRVEVGCADKTREAFQDVADFPNVAGCQATWTKALGICPEGHVGTNDGEYGCSACAEGWHVCGWQPSEQMESETCNPVNGVVDNEELSRHVCYEDCKAQPGLFASVGTHASVSVSPPFHGSDHTCAVCSGTQTVAGCGTLTQGGKTTPFLTTGADCTGFKTLSKLGDEVQRWPVNCNKNKACMGTEWNCCSPNEDKGTKEAPRGVMCCRDGIATSHKACDHSSQHIF